MRRPLPTPDVRRVRLRAAGRLGDFGELHRRKPRQDLPPEQLRVVDRTGICLVPLSEGPLASSDRCATPSSDLRCLRRVGGDACLAADVARVRDGSSAVGTGPEWESRLSGHRPLAGSGRVAARRVAALRAFTTA